MARRYDAPKMRFLNEILDRLKKGVDARAGPAGMRLAKYGASVDNSDRGRYNHLKNSNEADTGEERPARSGRRRGRAGRGRTA